MAVNEPIDPRVRLAISQWPDDAPRGAVSTFCHEHDISRKSFYELRKRVKVDGPAAVLEPRTRRPKSSPAKLTDEVKQQAVSVRAALEASGLDHGPISVHDKMCAMGLEQVPSTASLARMFREAGVARLEPKKKPRSAWRRFVYPAPNACWQLDATEYVLSGGRKCVIFQLIDDHSRYAVASHVAWGETAKDAIVVVDKAIAAHGVPQRLLSDNGAALNPSRRGQTGQLVAHVSRLGVEAITGKPYKPTTQGKNERFHQTLFRYLDKQPLAEKLEELQAQVEAFDHIYNTERPHQGLPGRVTPLTAWETTPKVDPPRPKPDRPLFQAPAPSHYQRPRPQPPADLPAGTRLRTVATGGTVCLDRVQYKVDVNLAFGQVLVVSNGNKPGDTIIVTDLQGEVLAEHTRPAPGIRYVGNGRPPGTRPRKTGLSPKS
ncbi:integrase core domain-containing protein [Mycolicibacterium lutetiense]|uniref:Transposase InsO family protein n=1 Tax=Mycolicibacterium lutetiense TaxID=1641992 RepID=A0ABS4ZP46_9MYCO|nr:transposase InsO family protein [Mycolicibacterium lutetiense]